MQARSPATVVVGAGLMGSHHALAARRAGARIVAVLDADPARAARLASRHAAIACASLDLLPPGTDVDVVHVCTPATTHAALIGQALRRGCDVICEKPIAETHAELVESLTLADSCGRYLVGVHQYTRQIGFQELLRQREALGRLRRIEFTFCTAGSDLVPGMHPLRLVHELLPHPLSVLQALGVPLQTLHWQALATGQGEWQLSAAAGESCVSIAISTSGRPTRSRMAVVGTEGSAWLDFYVGHGSLIRGRVSRVDKMLRPFRESCRVMLDAAQVIGKRVLRREFAYPGLQQFVADCYAQRGSRIWLRSVHESQRQLYDALFELRKSLDGCAGALE